MGTATLTDTAVQLDTTSVTGLYKLDPPMVGDDGVAYDFGAALYQPANGFVDVFAADANGNVVSDGTDWVALINCSPLDAGWHGAWPEVSTPMVEFARAGYAVQHDRTVAQP